MGLGSNGRSFDSFFFSYSHLKVILSSYSSSPFLFVLSRSVLLFVGVWVCASVYTCVQGWEWWWQSRLKTSRKYWQWFTEAWQYFSLVHLDFFLCLSFSCLISMFSGQICNFLIFAITIFPDRKPWYVFARFLYFVVMTPHLLTFPRSLEPLPCALA